MKKLLLCTFVLASFLLGGVANAGFVTFDFAANNLIGGQLNVAGYTLQVEAWTAQHNTGTNPWTTTNLAGSTITWISGKGLGVDNPTADGVAPGVDGELDTNLYNGNLGYQDWLSFKLLNPPVGTTKYTSVTYSGLAEWVSDANGEFSQARVSTKSGGILQGGVNPLGGPNSTDQKGLASDPETLALPSNFINGDWYLLVGPRLSGTGNSGTAGAGDSFRVAAVTMDIPGAVVPIPGAVWLLASGLVGLVGLRKRFQN